MRLPEKVIEFLKMNPEARFKAREIAEWIWQTYPDECQEKMNRSKAIVQPANDKSGLLNQLVAEIGSHHKRIIAKEPKIRTTEEQPRRYYYSTRSEIETDTFIIARSVHSLSFDGNNPQYSEEGTTEKAKEVRLTEHDLYPLLSQYLAAEYSVHTKRVDEKKSSNKRGPGGNHWRFPDLVGLEDLSSDWTDNVKECARRYGDQKACLWSFEVKLLLNMSNVRESFFQAASNSSWANLGYLVAGEITGKDTMQELKMLCGLHGIGFIRLDTGAPTESEMIIPAKEADVDWHSADRLARENSDFSEFIELVTRFHGDGKIHPYEWDTPLEDED